MISKTLQVSSDYNYQNYLDVSEEIYMILIYLKNV